MSVVTNAFNPSTPKAEASPAYLISSRIARIAIERDLVSKIPKPKQNTYFLDSRGKYLKPP